MFKMVASQDATSLNYQTALRIYVRVLVDNMWLTQIEKPSRMQRNKLHRQGQVLLIATKNDAVPQVFTNNGETFLLRGLKR